MKIPIQCTLHSFFPLSACKAGAPRYVYMYIKKEVSVERSFLLLHYLHCYACSVVLSLKTTGFMAGWSVGKIVLSDKVLIKS